MTESQFDQNTFTPTIWTNTCNWAKRDNSIIKYDKNTTVQSCHSFWNHNTPRLVSVRRYQYYLLNIFKGYKNILNVHTKSLSRFKRKMTTQNVIISKIKNAMKCYPKKSNGMVIV